MLPRSADTVCRVSVLPQRLLPDTAAVGDDGFLTIGGCSIRDLAAGNRKNQHRFAHSMKSNARLMGAHKIVRLDGD